MTPSSAVFIRGDLISLRSLTAADCGEQLAAWLNDREVTRHLVRGTFPASADELREDFRKQSPSQSDIQVAVVENRSQAYLGIAGLHGIAWIARHAEFRILLGVKEAWGKGYGTQAAQLLIAYAMRQLNLNKVWLGVNASNGRAVESYRKTGFVEEGVLRQEVFRNGKYHPVVRMSMLRSEYEEISKRWPIHELIAKQFPE